MVRRWQRHFGGRIHAIQVLPRNVIRLLSDIQRHVLDATAGGRNGAGARSGNARRVPRHSIVRLSEGFTVCFGGRFAKKVSRRCHDHVMRHTDENCSEFTVAIEPIPFEVVAAFLRVGRKYGIRSLETEAIRRLAYEYPSTLEDFITHECFKTIKSNGVLDRDVIRLAREHKLFALLPTAFYRVVSSLQPEMFFAPCERTDGSTFMLSSTDQMVALSGWKRLLSHQTQTTYSWITVDDGYNQCVAGECLNKRKTILRTIFLKTTLVYDLEDWKPSDFLLCRKCSPIAQKLYVEGKKKFWDDLPSKFNLSKWDDLLLSLQ